MLRNLVPRVWKLRQRFGIAAPRVTIQSQIPWYWRWIGIAVLLGISAASASWIYDAGRRFAGFDRSEVQEELRATRSALEDARAELDRLRAITNAADNRLAIERTAEQLVDAVHCHARTLALLAPALRERGVAATRTSLVALMAEMERRFPGSREQSVFASVEHSLQRMTAANRDRTGP